MVNLIMWHELIWNIDFLRGLIFFALGILAAILLIPRILKRRDKQLAKALLRKWGNTCVSTITELKPDTETEQMARMELFESGEYDLSGYVSTEETIHQIWQDNQNGRREPDGSAMIISNALEKVLYSDEERKNKELPSEKTYQFPCNLAALTRLWVRTILNPMYAKMEIFDAELLPIGELELVLSHLDEFSQQGYFSRHEFMSCVLHLAQSMEKFAKYLRKLDNWPNKLRTRCRELFSRMLRRA